MAHSRLSDVPAPLPAGPVLSAADYVKLLRVRNRHRGELAQRLRDAGPGSTVVVAGEAGETTEYLLVGRRDADSAAREVSLASPVGRALVGARPGDVARVPLPSGRDRALRVLEVTGGLLVAEDAPAGAAVKAA